MSGYISGRIENILEGCKVIGKHTQHPTKWSVKSFFFFPLALVFCRINWSWVYEAPFLKENYNMNDNRNHFAVIQKFGPAAVVFEANPRQRPKITKRCRCRSHNWESLSGVWDIRRRKWLTAKVSASFTKILLLQHSTKFSDSELDDNPLSWYLTKNI